MIRRENEMNVVTITLLGEWLQIKTENGLTALVCTEPADDEWIKAFDDDDPEVLEELIKRRFGE